MARVSRLAEFKLDPYASFLRFRRRSGRNEWIRTILNEDVFPPRGKEWMDLYGWIRKEWDKRMEISPWIVIFIRKFQPIFNQV